MTNDQVQVLGSRIRSFVLLIFYFYWMLMILTELKFIVLFNLLYNLIVLQQIVQEKGIKLREKY